MKTVSSVWMVIGKSSEKEIGELQNVATVGGGSWLEAERALVFDVHVVDRMQPVPGREPAGDDKSDENTNREKLAIRRESDEEDGHDCNGGEKGGGALQA